MPSPSVAKRRPMVRQYSLQNNLNSPSPAARRGVLKKQLSEDDGKSRAIDHVEITGQGWNPNNEKPEAGLRVGSSEGTATAHGKPTGARPRPVKLAWAERKQESVEIPTGVEVVARKCQGQFRPVTAKAQRVTNLPLLGDKDTLVYTRQQLAERLRRAWKEREKNRPNLDIFLAHGSETARSVNDEPLTERSVNVPQTETEIVIRDSVSSDSGATGNSDRWTHGDKRKPEPVRAVSQENHVISFVPAPRKPAAKFFGEPKGILKVANSKAVKSQPESERRLQEQNKIEIGVSGREAEPCAAEEAETVKSPALADLIDFKTFPVADASKKFGSDFASIGFQMKSIDVPSKRNEAPMKIKHSRNKENMGSSMSESPRSDSSYSERSKIGKMDVAKPEEPEPPPVMTAQARRASFRSSSFLHKTISGSFSSPLPDSGGEFDDDTIRNKNEIKVVLTKNNDHRPPLTRTLSAPTRNEPTSQANVQQPVNQTKNNIKFNNPKRGSFLNQSVTSMDTTGIPNEEDSMTLRDRIKSAPTRRKLKTAASRRKNKDKGGDSSEDEKEPPPKESSATKKSTRRRPVIKNAGDIVTMVSLVSPATSDTEDSVIHLPVEILAPEENEEAGQNSNSASSAGTEEPKDATSFIIQKFVSLRKTTKTVSFQQHPPVNRSYSASFPSRRAPAGTPIIIPSPVQPNSVLTPAQLQEKRSQSTSGTVSGADSRGIKRRLIRTTSAPLKDDEVSSDENSKTDTSTEPVYDRKKEEDGDDQEEEEEEDPNKEPDFKSPKEKECWILYRKMLEKGVSVSYDTVLRGMLTPTEYRLRRNHLLSSY